MYGDDWTLSFGADVVDLRPRPSQKVYTVASNTPQRRQSDAYQNEQGRKFALRCLNSSKEAQMWCCIKSSDESSYHGTGRD